ncbi:hypothetical protein AB1Y20_008556 [Prymnesium parvum]|uniref:CDAN1-interacting nuclease 1 n=1 Tax=Prymnesium parvum TaxID=97485 RepID=A0AB34IQM6_PRYPA
MTRIEKTLDRTSALVEQLAGHARNRDMYLEAVATDHVCKAIDDQAKKCWHVRKLFNLKFQTEKNGKRSDAIEIGGLVQCEAVDNCREKRLVVIEVKSCLNKDAVDRATKKKKEFWDLIQGAKQQTEGASPRDIPGYLHDYLWYCGLQEEHIRLVVGSNLVNDEHADQITKAGHLPFSCNTCTFQKMSNGALNEWLLLDEHCTPQDTAQMHTTGGRSGARRATRR